MIDFGDAKEFPDDIFDYEFEHEPHYVGGSDSEDEKEEEKKVEEEVKEAVLEENKQE